MKSIGYTTDVMTSASKLIQHHGDKMKYHRWLITLLIFMSIFFVHNESPVQTSSDSRWFVPTAMSIIKERNVNIDEYDFFIEQARNYGVEELDGNKYNFFPIGTAIVAVPFVWLFDFYFDKTIGLSFNTALKHDPLEDLEKFIASIIVALTAVMIFLIAEALCRNIPLSVLVVCIFSFCTPAWSTASRALWQHGPSMLMLSIALYCFIEAKRESRWIQLSGIPLAIAFTIRPTNIISLALFMLLVLVDYRKYFIRSLLPVLIVLTPFAILNLNIYGSIFPTYYHASRISFGSHIIEALAGNIISPNRGIFIWSPVLLLSIYGGFLKFRRKQFDKLDATLTCIVLIHWLVISSIPHWWGGGSIGPRFFTDMVPFFIYFLIPAVSILSPLNLRKLVSVGIFMIFIAFSFFTHYRGANSTGAIQWIVFPEHIDRNPARVWDWGDLQFLRKSKKGNPGLDTSLIVAARWGPPYNVEYLLDLGADIEARTSDGTTPLLLAAWEGRLYNVMILLDRGADVNVQNVFDITPLIAAAWNGHAEIVEMLLEAGADVNAERKEGTTALMAAAGAGKREAIDALLKKCTSVDTKDIRGETALIYAARGGHTAIVETLLERGANPGVKSVTGETALSFATSRCHTEIVELLKNAGAEK